MTHPYTGAVIARLHEATPAVIDLAIASAARAPALAMPGNFHSSGQVCSNGTKGFRAAGIKDRFLARLAGRTARIVAGDPLDPATQFGPLASQAQHDKVMGCIGRARAGGARLVTKARFSCSPRSLPRSPMTWRWRPRGLWPGDGGAGLRHRGRGDHAPNATRFGLAAGVFTADLARAHRVTGRLQAGTCWINAYNLTPVEMPFGGGKASGGKIRAWRSNITVRSRRSMSAWGRSRPY